MNTRKGIVWSLLSVFLLVLLVACGGGGTIGNPPPGGGGSSAVSLTVGDAPPAGVTVLSFEATITAATLTPASGSPVALLSSPVSVELKRLEAQTSFLATANVPAGTYNSMTVNFANVELTIKNDTGAGFTFAGVNCPAGGICEFKPGAPGAVTYSGTPFPLTIASGAPVGLHVDVNLNNVLQSPLGVNFGAANVITVQTLPRPGTPAGRLDDLEEICGVVTAKDAANNRFTLQTGGTSITVPVDNNTQFDDFDDIGLANTFASLAVNQIVEVELKLMAGGALLASEVELKDGDNTQEEIEAVVAAVDSPTQFRVVALEICPPITGLEIGDVLTVTLQQGVQFRVDQDGNMVPSGLRNAFEGASDTSELIAGQQVKIRRRSGSSGANIQTDRVRLRRARFTATVQTVTPPNFNVNNLPAIFTNATPAITQIQVQTIQQTAFQGVNSVSGLVAGDLVALRGLLFKGTTTPVLVAKKVRKR